MRRIAVLLVGAMVSAGGAWAAEPSPIKIGTALDFSVLMTRNVPEYSQGQRDYIALINARGGIDGHPVEILIADHGSDPQRGIEAYRRFKEEGAVLCDFLSTPVSRAIVPQALADGMNVMTLFHGRADAADGRVFPTIFPLSATPWSQAADIVKYIDDEEKELINKRRIAMVAIDNDLGHEVEPLLRELAKRLRFTFDAFYYPAPGTDQAAAWKQAARFKPDWTLIWGAGIGQGYSIREAAAVGIRLDHLVSNVSLEEGELDIIGAEKAAGVLRFEGVASGSAVSVIADIRKEVIAAGHGAGSPEIVGRTYYNAGVAGMALFAEAARLALHSQGEPLTAAKLKLGFEQLHDYTADDLLPATTITARDHQGGGRGRIVQWDGKKWNERRHWFGAYQDIVWNLIGQASSKFKASGK
jgi:branched-chain amino acid transport system substrate-binding protein